MDHRDELQAALARIDALLAEETLRDRFAMSVMNGFSSAYKLWNYADRKNLAERAYEVADAMLVARRK